MYVVRYKTVTVKKYPQKSCDKIEIFRHLGNRSALRNPLSARVERWKLNNWRLANVHPSPVAGETSERFPLEFYNKNCPRRPIRMRVVVAHPQAISLSVSEIAFMFVSCSHSIHGVTLHLFNISLWIPQKLAWIYRRQSPSLSLRRTRSCISNRHKLLSWITTSATYAKSHWDRWPFSVKSLRIWQLSGACQ